MCGNNCAKCETPPTLCIECNENYRVDNGACIDCTIEYNVNCMECDSTACTSC